MMPEVKICAKDEIPDGGVRIVSFGELEVGLIRQAGNLYAYRNLCPHQGGPACEGVRMPGVVDEVDQTGNFLGQKFNESEMHIVCPWHGYEYRLKDGVNVCDPRLKLQKFPVIERNGYVYLSV
jgi:nitrite reductase/ring-hydroxylating ferredoxin subunit